MYCSAIAAVPIRSWMKVTRSASASSVSTTEAWAMPIEASSFRLLTISGSASRGGRLILRPIGNTTKAGVGTR